MRSANALIDGSYSFIKTSSKLAVLIGIAYLLSRTNIIQAKDFKYLLNKFKKKTLNESIKEYIDKGFINPQEEKEIYIDNDKLPFKIKIKPRVTKRIKKIISGVLSNVSGVLSNVPGALTGVLGSIPLISKLVDDQKDQNDLFNEELKQIEPDEFKLTLDDLREIEEDFT